MYHQFAAYDFINSVIARAIPGWWEVVGGGPAGPHAGYAALNPQPLPPVADGLRVALTLVSDAQLAARLGIAYEPGDELCPRPRKKPKGWPPIGGDDPIKYASDLAAGLELTRSQWHDLDSAAAIQKVLDSAYEFTG